MRDNCPKKNVGKVFGCVNFTDTLQGSMLAPDYCIVDVNGNCLRHGDINHSAEFEVHS